jgi:ELWxxDGT repeat protein/VCBS repeat-containing protein
VKHFSDLSNRKSLVNAGGSLFFRGGNSANGYELWRSDGTPTGTVMVKDIYPGSYSGSPQFLTNLNGALIFAADDGFHGDELWRSDGTAAGTTLVRDLNQAVVGSDPHQFTSVNDTLFFSANDGIHGEELWRSDGSPGGASLVKDILAGSGNGLANTVTRFSANVNGTLFFTANDGTAGVELWRSDGTAAGTTLVKDIYPGISQSLPSSLINLNGTLLFWATDGTNGTELWRSDGTAPGTTLVKDIYLGIGSSGSFGNWFVNVGSTLFFAANDGVNGTELWCSDGTAAGTTLVQDIRSGSSGSAPRSATNVNGTLFFAANDGINGYELWRSDGTAADTTMVKNIGSGASAGDPHYLTNVNGTLWFVANDGSVGNELWRSDGTTTGTAIVQDIRPGFAGSYPQSLNNLNGVLLFEAAEGTHGSELWSSSGASTAMVKDILAGAYSSLPTNLVNLNGTLLFSASDPTGRDLWQSDGTASGTRMASNVASPASSSTTNILGIGNLLFYAASTISGGTELYTYGLRAESATTTEDAPLNGTLTGSDPDGDPLTYIVTSGPSHGVFTSFDSNTGAYTYQPNPDYNGSDTFTYKVNDGTVDSNQATINITISPVNDPPQITSGATFTPNEQQTAVGTLTASDVDAGDSASFSATITGPDAAKFSITAAGVLTFNAPPDFENPGDANGDNVYLITVKAQDTSAANTTQDLTITVQNVNDNAPVFNVGTSSFSVPEGSKPVGTVGATDGDGNPVTYSFAGGANDSLFTLSAGTGALSFIAAPDYETGPHSYSVKVQASDGVHSTIQNVTVNVTDVNDAPTMSTANPPPLDAINEDSAPYGTPVWKLITGITDADANAKSGLAITYVSNATSGVWQFTLNGGTTWTSFPATSTSNARLLPANGGQSRIRFVLNGTVKIGYYAWDQAQGTAGGTVDVSPSGSHGGSAPFSTTYRLSSLAVQPVNDAPVMSTSSSPTLVAINEDNRTSLGTTVASLATGVSDVDVGAKQGLAISTASNLANGTWQYTLDNGATWINFPATSATAALLLPANGNLCRIRFQPNQDFNGTVKIGYFAWDQTQGAAGGTLDISTTASRGGTKAFSAAYRTSALTIKPVNDPPVLQGVSGTMGYVHDTAPIVLAATATVGDVDSADFNGGRLVVHISSGASTSNRLQIGAGFTVDASNNVLQGTIIRQQPRAHDPSHGGWGGSKSDFRGKLLSMSFCCSRLIQAEKQASMT